MDWHDYDAALFDLDGVLTPTAEVHMRAWRDLFTDYLTLKGETSRPYVDADYFAHIDGKPRYDGVRDFLASRGIPLAEGEPSDPPDADTVCGLGNRKNDFFAAALASEGVEPYAGSVALLDHLESRGIKVAVVSSSRNAPAVLDAAGLADRFEVVVDGQVAAEAGLPGKPAPDTFLEASNRLGVDPERAVVFEDAVSGVAAGHAGGFGLVVGVDRGVGADALTDAGADQVVDRPRGAGGAVRGFHEDTPPHHGDPVDRIRFPVREWSLSEVQYGTEDLGVTETLFAVGNGYLGMRGNVEEGRETYAHGTFINGFHETYPIRHAEEAFGFAKVGQTIVNVPDNKTIKLYVDDEPLLLSVADLERYDRTLDFRAGVLTRDLHLAHPRRQARPGDVAPDGELHPAAPGDHDLRGHDARRQRARGDLEPDAQPPGRARRVPRALRRDGGGQPRRPAQGRGVPRAGARAADALGRRPAGSMMGYRCAHSGMTLAVGVDHEIITENAYTEHISADEDTGKMVYRVAASRGQTITIVKTVTYHTSRGVPVRELNDRCRRVLDRVAGHGVDRELAAQRAWLDAYWERSDVVIADQPDAAAGRALEPVPGRAGRRPRRAVRGAGQGRHGLGLQRPLLLGHRDLRHAVPDVHLAGDGAQRDAVPLQAPRRGPRAGAASSPRRARSTPGGRSTVPRRRPTTRRAPPSTTSTPTWPSRCASTWRPAATTTS